MKTLKMIVTAVFMVVVLTVVAVIAVLINPKLGARAIRTFEQQPYQIIIYGYSLPSFAMPGQSGDREGFARVYNRQSGTMLCEVDVPQAGHIYDVDVRWGRDSVTFPGDEGFQACRLW